MSGGAPAGDGPVVFVSYSHEDSEWQRRFAEMLTPLVRERRLEVWSDDRMVVGYTWRPQLAEAIARSRAALLLVSPSFLASDFIMERELLGTLGGLQVHDLTGINNNGQIVGWGDTSTGTTHGFLDTNGTVTDLGAFLPNGLNDNGVIIGTELNGGAFIDSGGTVQDLNNLIPASSGYTITEAVAINDNGQIDATTSTGHAVLLTPN